MDFSPFPVLETTRLTLRRALATDAEDLFEMRSDPQVMQFIPREVAKTTNDILALLELINSSIEKGERINWAIEWKETKKVVGLIGFVNILPDHFRAEVGYSLNRSFHLKGIASEALKSVVTYGFESMNLHSVLAITDAQNDASGKLLLKTGFRKEGHFLEDFLWKEKFRDSIHYGLLKSEWNSED